jgi:hypothetical protein
MRSCGRSGWRQRKNPDLPGKLALFIDNIRRL